MSPPSLVLLKSDLSPEKRRLSEKPASIQ